MKKKRRRNIKIQRLIKPLIEVVNQINKTYLDDEDIKGYELFIFANPRSGSQLARFFTDQALLEQKLVL